MNVVYVAIDITDVTDAITMCQMFILISQKKNLKKVCLPYPTVQTLRTAVSSLSLLAFHSFLDARWTTNSPTPYGVLLLFDSSPDSLKFSCFCLNNERLGVAAVDISPTCLYLVASVWGSKVSSCMNSSSKAHAPFFRVVY